MRFLTLKIINHNQPLPHNTKNAEYQKDTKQLQEDRAYFESLFAAAKEGDTKAAKELQGIQVQQTVQVHNSNDRLLNENTAYLIHAQSELKENINNDSKANNSGLSQEQQSKKDAIMSELGKDPNNTDITEEDVQQFLLEEAKE